MGHLFADWQSLAYYIKCLGCQVIEAPTVTQGTYGSLALPGGVRNLVWTTGPPPAVTESQPEETLIANMEFCQWQQHEMLRVGAAFHVGGSFPFAVS
jgi:hypothetical protein